MTTYTLSETEILALKEMVAYGYPKEALTVLLSLKPNSQEPIGLASNMPGTDGFTMACFKAVDVPVGAAIYTHPAPISKEDMVKVLGALVDVDISLNTMFLGSEAAMNHAVKKHEQRREAITIMQSAIEATGVAK